MRTQMFQTRRMTAVALFLACAFAGMPRVAAEQARNAGDAVALVSRISGAATVRSSGQTRSLRLFDRVFDGDNIRTEDGAEVVLAFRTGARTRIGSLASADIEASTVEVRAGVVEALPAVPVVPLVAPVAGESRTIAAVRIRAGEIDIVSPVRGEVIVPGEALTLEYGPEEAESYAVDVERPDATIVFQARTRDTRATVPAEALEPGHVYRWRVTARWPSGFVASADGAFQTLSPALAGERAALRAALADTDVHALALLAEVDYSLGLWRHAWRQFTSARAAGVSDDVIAERLADIERRFPRGVEASSR